MKTCDLSDKYGNIISVAEPIGLKHYGGIKEFSGEISTVKCFEDNSMVRQVLETHGNGRVLVVDGGGSKKCALLGDVNANLGKQNNWRGIIIYGYIRDSEAMSKLELGVMALGTNPRKSTKRNDGIIGVPVHFAQIDFVPGSFVYIDLDGIVVSSEPLVL